MKSIFAALGLTLVSSSLYAQDLEEPLRETSGEYEEEDVEEAASAPTVPPRSTRDNRRDSNLSLFIEPLNVGLILPLKTGFAVSWIHDEDWTLEAEYLEGNIGVGVLGVDLADFSERLIIGRTRYHLGNSFNLSAGLGVRNYSFQLGSDMLQKLVTYDASGLPMLKAQNEVLTLGAGNRWIFDNGITLGLDWFELVATVGRGTIEDKVSRYFRDPKDRHKTRSVLNYLRYGPTFNVLKLQIGYTF